VAAIAGLIAAIAVVAVLRWRADRTQSAQEKPGDAPVVPPAAVQVPRRISADSAPAPAPRRPVELSPARAERDPDYKNGIFSGEVLNWSSGEGVAGAEITFAIAGNAVSARADADGRFEFEPPELGVYQLATVTADRFLPFAPEWEHSPIVLTARSGVRITGILLYLVPAVDYVGRVVNAGGQPVAGARIKLVELAGEQRLVPIDSEFTSAQDGTFVFHAPDGTMLEASHPKYGRGRAVLSGAVTVTHKIDILLTLTSAGSATSIAGRVIDEAGNPIAGAEVLASADPNPTLLSTGLAHSDEGGRFHIEPLDETEYVLTASAEGYARRQAMVRAGVRDLEIVLSAGARILGRVADEQGRSVSAFTIVVLRRDGPLARTPVAHTSVVDGKGQFEIGGLAAGNYAVVASAQGLAMSEEKPAEATLPNAAPRPVVIVLRAGGSLYGVVTDAASGKPLLRARVTAEGAMGAGSSALPVSRSAVSDEQGKFELGGLRPGLASLFVAAYQHHFHIVSGLQVVAGHRSGPVQVALTPLAEGELPMMELAGIGAALSAADDGLAITKVMTGGGAADAGLVNGDVILAVDGDQVIELGFEGTIERIRGPVGTGVRLKVRKGNGAVIELTATRKKIRA
jgi:hypothetical protein